VVLVIRSYKSELAKLLLTLEQSLIRIKDTKLLLIEVEVNKKRYHLVEKLLDPKFIAQIVEQVNS
jgi:hypothetical protein